MADAEWLVGAVENEEVGWRKKMAPAVAQHRFVRDKNRQPLNIRGVF